MALPKKLNDADKKLLHDSATDCRAVATDLDAYAECASDMQARRARQAILMLRQRLLVLIETGDAEGQYPHSAGFGPH